MKITNQAKCYISALNFWSYCKTVAPDFYKEERTYLKTIADTLEEFFYSNDRVLLINLPPRFGKSRTATLFTQWILGKDTTLKIMTGSYNQDLSKQFSGQVRNAIQEEKTEEDTIVYSDIFPNTKVKFGEAKAHKWALEGNNFTNYLATSPKGSATGFGADCFPKGTMISTVNGLKDIEELYLNPCPILSYDHKNKVTRYNNIQATRRIVKNEFIELTTNTRNKIKSTLDHRYYVEHLGYIKAKHIQVGYYLKNENNEKVMVSSIEYSEGEEFVYDIQVERDNNFFANGVLVHNCLIIDDLIKSLEDANNSNVLNKQWEWFTGTMFSRLQGKRKTIIIMTRWTKKDLAGRMIRHCNEVLKLPVKHLCMKAYDGEKHLCEDVLPAEEYAILEKTIPLATFNANYNQETVDEKGALYKKFLIYNQLPNNIIAIENYTDTADKGSDYLCSISYAVDTEGNAFILDIVYTKAAMEVTEGLVAKSLYENKVAKARIESNNGGRGFARNVKAKLKEKEYKMEMRSFHQGDNKQTRILTGSSLVENTVYYPVDWESRFSNYAEDIKDFQREGKNEHDDCADAITGVVEYAGRKARRKNNNFSWFNSDKKNIKSEVIE
ncbi:phage terminase large subunit [Clostridium chrysemydis]|uniref:phage terminase large subunit n=1 Tax=Clostridium chrysemydis TaxID=2665504 RepID=UPI003F33F786